MTANGCLHTVSTISLLPSYFHSTKARKNGFFRGDNSTVFVEHIFLSLRALRMSVQSLRWSNAYWPPVFGEVPVLADGECSLLPAVLVRRSQASKHTGELPPPPRFFSQCLQQACFPPLPSLSSHTAGRAVRRGLKKIFVGGGRKERGGKKGIEELSRKVSAVKYHFLLPYCVFQEPMMYDTLKQNVQQ